MLANENLQGEDAELLPVRMLNEFAYCPRLFHQCRRRSGAVPAYRRPAKLESALATIDKPRVVMAARIQVV